MLDVKYQPQEWSTRFDAVEKYDKTVLMIKNIRQKMFYFQTAKCNIFIIIVLPFYDRDFFPYIRCDYNAGNNRLKLCRKSVMRTILITCRSFITVLTLIFERLSQNSCAYFKHRQQVSTLSNRRNSSLLIFLPSSEFSSVRMCFECI